MTAKIRRYISPATHDYVVDAGGLKGDTGYTSQVVLALGTQRGTCQVAPEFGSRIHTIRKADETGRKLCEKYAVEALPHVAAKVKSLTATATLSTVVKGAIELVVEIDPGRGLPIQKIPYTAQLGNA